VQAIEHQVAHVHHVRLLEEDCRIAAGVSGAVVVPPHLLVADRRRPALTERDVGVGLLRRGVVLLGELLVQLRAALLLDD
jgi:hypothetical protein